MTESSPGSPNPFAVSAEAETEAEPREPLRSRHMSLPLCMNDGAVKTFYLPAALANPTHFAPGELERLTRAYTEALGLL